jgi:hypothetical protein
MKGGSAMSKTIIEIADSKVISRELIVLVDRPSSGVSFRSVILLMPWSIF